MKAPEEARCFAEERVCAETRAANGSASSNESARGASLFDLLQPGLRRGPRGRGRLGAHDHRLVPHPVLFRSALSRNSMPSGSAGEVIVLAEKFASEVASRNSRNRRAKSCADRPASWLPLRGDAPR